MTRRLELGNTRQKEAVSVANNYADIRMDIIHTLLYKLNSTIFQTKSEPNRVPVPYHYVTRARHIPGLIT